MEGNDGGMRYLESENRNVFYKEPTEFHRNSAVEILKYAVGGLLYTPVNNGGFVDKVRCSGIEGLVSLAICMEDAVGGLKEVEAEGCLAAIMNQLKEVEQELPLLFIRPRSPQQLSKILKIINPEVISGFILPKITSSSLEEYIHIIPKDYYIMPILESEEIIYKETRLEELQRIKAVIDQEKRRILNVRIGGTDFCKTFGFRRDIESTIYDLAPIRDCIADIINIFGREDYVLSAPVWEYYNTDKAVKGLINEQKKDILHGLVGKTVVHPSQLKVVQSQQVVGYEEYMDAVSIVEEFEMDIKDYQYRGVLGSPFKNKMNEVKPHYKWAKKILERANIYGVYKEKL